MSNAVLFMSMSVDGFITGPNDGPSNGLGDGGHRLHEWFGMDPKGSHNDAVARLSGVNRQVMDEVMATGAVVTGRRTFEHAGGWAGDHHDGVPIFVLVHGAVTAHLALIAGVLDELHIHLVPVLLGQGRRLFEDMPPEHSCATGCGRWGEPGMTGSTDLPAKTALAVVDEHWGATLLSGGTSSSVTRFPSWSTPSPRKRTYHVSLGHVDPQR